MSTTDNKSCSPQGGDLGKSECDVTSGSAREDELRDAERLLKLMLANHRPG